MSKKQSFKGGEFIIRDRSHEQVFIPEDFSEEDTMIAQSTFDFIEQHITKNIEKIEAQEPGILESLIESAGEIGIIGITLPEEYGGMNLNTSTMLLVADMFGLAGSFSTTYGVQSGIGILPIAYYGTEEQKKKYLPKMISGQSKGAYCLTEPDAGSDANSGKTKAVLSDDGKYYEITGQKMWISNGGFADVFTVFARIEDDKNMSCFIVEKDFGGITLNPEEKKLGIKGSSTRQVFFNKTKVPVENLLSERGNGFKVAVNILNIGRIKLGAGILAGGRSVLANAYNYASERVQFEQPILNFGAIKSKLADMMTKIYITESLCYRIGKDMDDQIETLKEKGLGDIEAKLKGVEEYAIEASIAKVFGSEALDFVVDEGLQIYGGMGYSAEAPMERPYRDARISRIYEGTSEINRLLMVGMLLKKGMKGEIDIMSKINELMEEITGLPTFEESSDDDFFASDKKMVAHFKKVFLMIGGKAAQVYAQNIEQEQEVMMNLADILIHVYASECGLLRAEKIYLRDGESEAQKKINMARIFISQSRDIIQEKAKEVISRFDGDENEKQLMRSSLRRFLKNYDLDTIGLKRKVLDAYSENMFPF